MFVTVCNKEYLIGFEVMIKSLVSNNPRIVKEDIPFTIISNDLTSEDLTISRKIYNNISIKRYDASKYSEIEELKNQQMGFGDYTKYEIFSIDNSEKIIFFISHWSFYNSCSCESICCFSSNGLPR